MSQIIITGMHRSGTSLVSSLLQSAGIHIGDKLLEANSANPRGYFEDVDFYEFQDQLLRERGQTYLHVNQDFTFEPTDAETARAWQLIAERAHRPLWGWKDPRTSLFLDFWHKLLPNARFLFVYRHPIEVLLSLLRRGEFDSHPSLAPGLNAWLKYNSSILKFYNQNMDRCLLVHIKALTQNSAKFTQLLQKKLCLASGPSQEAFAQIYCKSDLKQTAFPPDLGRAVNRIFPPLLPLYQQCNQEADLPAQETAQNSQASLLLSPLVQLTEALPHASSLPIQQGVLQLLVTLLEPQLAEQMLVKSNESGKQTQRKVDYLWMHAQHVQRQNVELEQELKLRAAKIEALTGELAAVRGTSPTDAILKNSQGSNRA